MNKQVESARDPNMLDDYDFSHGERDKYAQRFAQSEMSETSDRSDAEDAALADCSPRALRPCDDEEFDYTQWRQPLFAELSGEEVSHRAMEYQRRKRGAVALVEDKVSDR